MSLLLKQDQGASVPPHTGITCALLAPFEAGEPASLWHARAWFKRSQKPEPFPGGSSDNQSSLWEEDGSKHRCKLAVLCGLNYREWSPSKLICQVLDALHHHFGHWEIESMTIIQFCTSRSPKHSLSFSPLRLCLARLPSPPPGTLLLLPRDGIQGESSSAKFWQCPWLTVHGQVAWWTKVRSSKEHLFWPQPLGLSVS